MSDKRNNKKKINTWLLVGALVLIVLLLLWLTVAVYWGDTDVAAFISFPMTAFIGFPLT